MSLPLTEALQELIELGVEGPALVAAMRRLEEATYAKPMATLRETVEEAARIADERKAKDAERKRVHRKSADIHGQASDVPADPPPLPTCAGKSLPTSSLRSEGIPPENPTGSTPKGADRSRGTRLPEGWEPEGEDWLKALDVLGGDKPAVDELDRFRDYWRAVPGAKGRKSDWPATWRNWVRRASENLARKTPHERPHNDPKFERRQANLARSFAGSERAAGRDWEP